MSNLASNQFLFCAVCLVIFTVSCGANEGGLDYEMPAHQGYSQVAGSSCCGPLGAAGAASLVNKRGAGVHLGSREDDMLETIVDSESTTAMTSYSSHPRTQAMIRYGKKYAGLARGFCLRGVKRAMTYGGRYFSSYPGVAWATNFGPELGRVAFSDIYANGEYRRRIQESMLHVPIGCIVVYRGINLKLDRNAKYGHIEIRTTDGFVSDYFSSRPRTGSWARYAGNNREVKGVYCRIGMVDS